MDEKLRREGRRESGGCPSTAAADDPEHYLRAETFGHVCARAGIHDRHRCACGYEWSR